VFVPSRGDDPAVRNLRSVVALGLVLAAVPCFFVAAIGFFLAYAAFFPTGETPVGPLAAIVPTIGALVCLLGAACLWVWPTRAQRD
jgi:hypothetical protein